MIVANPPKEHDQYLYHYTKASTLLDILRHRCIRFNSITNVNDPREAKNWNMGFDGPLSILQNLDLGEIIAQNNALSDRLKKAAKVLCLCRDIHDPVQRDVMSDIFLRGYAKPSLWHHYGDEHKGACLILERAELEQSIIKAKISRFTRHGPVSYKNPCAFESLDESHFILRTSGDITDQEIELHIKEHHEELFFSKLTDWQNESEYRFLIYNDDSAYTDIPLNSSLRGVILGEAHNEENAAEILRHCIELELEIAHMKWTNGVPGTHSENSPYHTKSHLFSKAGLITNES